METLGYVFSYKDGKKLKRNQFSISTISGVSDRYPVEYENKKDFNSMPIKQGETSSLYMSLSEAQHHFADEVYELKKFSDYKESWRKYYSHALNWEDWLWCWGMEGVHINAMISNQLIEDDVLYALGLTDDLEAKVKVYRELSEKEYDEELKRP